MIDLSIKQLKSEKLQSGVQYGQFLIDNLQPGQGITIGNQLRRVLLGDLGGNAISAVRIMGINHEFSTIPGVREDILEILLNLKGIVIKSNTSNTRFARLKIQGPLVITADLIELPSGLEIINPNHYIATISTPNTVEIEFKIDYGTGYKLASHIFDQEYKDFLQMDTIFMPVQKANFKVENIYNDDNTITERLFLEVWTNGSINPIDALKQASKLIVELFTALVESKESEYIPEQPTKQEIAVIEPYANLYIEELQLSVRAYNCLKKAKIDTVADLLKYSLEQLKELKNFGKKSSDEVVSTLKTKLGITFN